MAKSNVDAHLEISPESAIVFELDAQASETKVILNLKHPDPDSPAVAFKVKTTQPRRYLVRPNQGLIQPGKSEDVTILLVDRDKDQLIANYNSLGDAALASCKDKFLVQSIAVDNAKELSDYDSLSKLWSTMPSSNTAIANKKLPVQHKMKGSSTTGATPTPPRNTTDVKSMNDTQKTAEIQSLRRKYDELVAFSVNLTAERDMLNNSLEQTKRDLQGERRIPKTTTAPPKKAGTSNVNLVLVALLCVLIGAKLQQLNLLSHVPVIGSHFSESGSDEL